METNQSLTYQQLEEQLKDFPHSLWLTLEWACRYVDPCVENRDDVLCVQHHGEMLFCFKWKDDCDEFIKLVEAILGSVNG